MNRSPRKIRDTEDISNRSLYPLLTMLPEIITAKLQFLLPDIPHTILTCAMPGAIVL